MPSYDTPGPIAVDIDLGVGYVEVIASDRPDATAEGSPTRAARSGDVSIAKEATVAFESGRLRIAVPRRRSLFGQSDSVDVRVELPTGSRLAIETAYGSVRVRGVVGDCRISAKYGSVAADAVGDLVLDAPYGGIDVDVVTGALDATAGHSHVRIGRIDGNARIRGSYGTIDIGTTSREVDVTTSGPLTIDRALGDVTARSAHGAIRIREASGRSVRLENGHAEVEVGVPSGVAAWIESASTHGNVRNELTPDPSAVATDRAIELRLRARADVIIRRAPSTARSGAHQ